MPNWQIYSLAILSNLAFSSSTLVFSIFAKKFSSLWMNQVKVMIAAWCFLAAVLLTPHLASFNSISFSFLGLSGMLGLCLGDLFLFRAFAALGASRTLVIFSFQPLMLGLYGVAFLNQGFSTAQILSVSCMICCLLVFIQERKKTTGSFDLKNFSWAFLGISLDAIGVMLTRSAYEIQPELESFQVNLIRCVGAIMAFILIRPKGYITVFKDFKNLTLKDSSLLIGACLTGTFLSLTLYLTALKYAHVGTLTAISITGPVWVAILESFYLKKWPSKYLITAFSFFGLGFYLML